MSMEEKCGTWILDREIGRGAYGIVYLATGPAGEKVAVKICRRDSLDVEHYERELRGAKLYKAIQTGEGLVRLLDFGECAWGFYTAMELADEEYGEALDEMSDYRPKTLSRVIAGERALPLADALKLGIALAKGLVTLQRHHLLHRDIKPGNVVYVRGRPVLSDLGLLVDEAEAASLVGTPGYVPPENFTGAGSDVYSLGLTLKAASFGRPVEELERGPTLEAETGNPLFPVWWRILNKATNPDAAFRYRSAKALLKDLQALRRRAIATTRVFGLPRYVWLPIGLTLVLLGVLAVKVKSDADRSTARWKQQDEFVAREVEKAKATVRRMLGDVDSNVKDSEKRLDEMRIK